MLYVKQAKVGELPEGEYPYNVISIDADESMTLEEKHAHYLANGYEDATEEEYKTFGVTPEGTTEADSSEEPKAEESIS